MTLRQWNDISEEFTDALILGNGASVAINDAFRYSSVWEAGVKAGEISDTLQVLSKQLKTGAKFELLLRQLLTAKTVDGVFKIDATAINNSYVDLRSALIKTVRDIHCTRNEAEDALTKAIPFLQNFQTIFSLNYDLLIYWAMMMSNNAQTNHRFKDCFNSGYFEEDWEDYRGSYRGEKSTTLVFFPHGALQFTQSNNDIEKKLGATNSPEALLEHVLHLWGRTSAFPLFVTEGDSSEKMHSIQRSKYLSTVYYDVLPESGSTLVIYGWSMDETVDGHLLEQIGKAKYKKLAIAVHQPTTPNIAYYKFQTSRKLERFGSVEEKDITYFDAESEGSWIYNEQAGDQ